MNPPLAYGTTLNRLRADTQVVGDDVRIIIDIDATERTTTP